MTECWVCNRKAKWNIRLYGYHSSSKNSCSMHVIATFVKMLAVNTKWEDYSLEVRRVKS